jgi:TNF receptor-associated factor 2/TNF receptor-associated factor 3
MDKFVELEKRVDVAVTTVNTLVSARDDEGVISMKSLLQEMQRTINSQNKKIEGQARDITRLMARLEETSLATKGPSYTREEYPRTSGFSTQEQLMSEASNTDGRMLQVTKSVEELHRTVSILKVHVSELELQLQASLASTHTGSFLWRIPEVARRKRDAFEGRITSIYSPPFYSGRNGYKMCIRCYLNGDGIGFNTHLSVFFVLMRGEYDPLLKWPFESKVSLVLVDQNLRQHVVQTFKPSPDSSSFQRPRSDMNIASGCPQFAKLSVLEEGNYVKNDVLFLKCIVDTSKIVHP